jgi:ABC-type multidrug transport system fused ATPase/permease subunit
MSLVEIADFVVVLEGGRIAETGAPRELIAGNSLLSRQFRLVNVTIPLVEAI